VNEWNVRVYKESGSKWLKRFNAPNINKIGSWAFALCHQLASVSFQSATIIGDNAFDNSSYGTFLKLGELSEIFFPNVTTIGIGAFSATKLTSVNYPKVLSVGGGAFGYCSYLTTAIFPKITNISEATFAECVELSYVSFSSNITSIGRIAFLNAIN